MSERLKVRFPCTGSSCRSQMAEGWARTLKSDEIRAFVETLPEALSEAA